MRRADDNRLMTLMWFYKFYFQSFLAAAAFFSLLLSFFFCRSFRALVCMCSCWSGVDVVCSLSTRSLHHSFAAAAAAESFKWKGKLKERIILARCSDGIWDVRTKWGNTPTRNKRCAAQVKWFNFGFCSQRMASANVFIFKWIANTSAFSLHASYERKTAA